MSNRKNFCILSSHHNKPEISPEEAQQKFKPNTVLDYNSTKCGVDSVDQMTRCYNVKSSTRRWPVQVFYNIINLSSINSWVLFKLVNKSKISRREFIEKLINEICDLAGTNHNLSELSDQILSTPLLHRKRKKILNASE